MLTKLIKECYIQLDIDATSFEEAITLSMQPLVNDKAVTDNYVNKVLTILQEIGPYIVITKHIAIPHAPSTAGAKKLAIGFTRLKTPIVSGNAANDPVKFLFSLSSPTGDDHLSALSELADLLGREQFLLFINQVQTAHDLIAFIKNFERSGKMIKALVACRAGVGSSLMLKIKLSEVIKENNFPITLEHASLDGVAGFDGKYIITLPDVAEELTKKKLPQTIIGIKNIIDKQEIKTKLQQALSADGLI